MVNLLRCCNTRVVAGRTDAIHDTRVMGKCAGKCTVAIVDHVTRSTVQLCCDVTRWFAFADITVMAGQTIVGVLTGVVKRQWTAITI